MASWAYKRSKMVSNQRNHYGNNSNKLVNNVNVTQAHTAVAEDETTADEEVEASPQVRVLPQQAPVWDLQLAERKMMEKKNLKEDEADWKIVLVMKEKKKRAMMITKMGMMNWKEDEEEWKMVPLEEDVLGHRKVMGCCSQHDAAPDMLATVSAAIPACIVAIGRGEWRYYKSVQGCEVGRILV